MQRRFDDLSREVARATSRRDAVRIICSAIFGGYVAPACETLTSITCTNGCVGTDNRCYTCDSPYYCSTSGGSGCGQPSAGGVYCCGGGGGGGGGGGTCECNRGFTYNFSSRRCCPSDTPYYFPVGAHVVAGKPGGYCYQSCPYVGDCGTQFRAC